MLGVVPMVLREPFVAKDQTRLDYMQGKCFMLCTSALRNVPKANFVKLDVLRFPSTIFQKKKCIISIANNRSVTSLTLHIFKVQLYIVYFLSCFPPSFLPSSFFSSFLILLSERDTHRDRNREKRKKLHTLSRDETMSHSLSITSITNLQVNLIYAIKKKALAVSIPEFI